MKSKALFRPRWLIAHVLVAAIAVVCVLLGMWQLRRHDERTTFNEAVASRAAGAPQPLPDAVAEEHPIDDLPPGTYRRVAVEGRYVSDRDVLLQGRALEGRPGNHVLTPLVTSGGDVLWVDRGWVPFQPADETEVHTPNVAVRLTGVLFPSESRGLARTPSGPLRVISHIDLDRLAEETDSNTYDLYLLLQSQVPAQPDGTPVPAPLPRLNATQNLSYAGQWFLFAAVAVIGYAVILRRRSRGADTEPPMQDSAPEASNTLR